MAEKKQRASWRMSARAMLVLVKVNLQQQLAYRDEIWSTLLQMFIEVVIFRQLWIALYQSREVVAGVTLKQAITYAVINSIVARLFSSWMIVDVNDKIHSGDIILDIARPIGFGNLIWAQATGEALATLLTASLPIAVIVHAIFRLRLPTSPLVWIAFGTSLILGFLTSLLIDYLIALSAFWLTEIGGFYWSKGSIIAILGGTYLPLWIYPPTLARILEWLPFRGISYTPLAIFVGHIHMDHAPLMLGLQAAWVLILAWLGRRLFTAAVKKLAVQGG